MIWKWADRKRDHFVTFDHEKQRLATLEADMDALTRDLLSCLEARISIGWMTSEKRLADTLQKISKRREGTGRGAK